MAPSTSVTRSATSLLASRLAVAGIGLAFLGVSARLLSVEQMAVFAVYNTLCGLMSVVGSLGLLSTCIRAVPGLTASPAPGDRQEAARLLRLTATVYLAGAAVTTGAVLLAARPLARLLLKDAGLGADLRSAALAAFCFGLYEAGQLLLSSLQQFHRVGRYNVSSALLQRLLSLGLWFPFGLTGYLAGFAIGSLAGAGLGLRRIIPAMAAAGDAGGTGPRRGAAGWIRYSVPFYVDGYLRYFYMHADQLLVAVFLSPGELSIYFIAKRFIAYGQVLVASLVDPLTTKASEMRQASPGALPGAFATASRSFVLLFVPLSVFLACLSPFLLAVVGGDTYAGGVIPLALLFLSLPLFAIFSQIAGFLYALGAPADRLGTNLVSSATQAAGIFLLLPWMGLPGLALARIAGFAVAAVHARHRLRRYLPGAAGPGSWRPEPARTALRCVGPVAVMALLVTGPHLALGRAHWIPLYAVPAGIVGMALLLRFTLTLSDRQALASLVPGRGRGAAGLRTLLAGDGPDARDAAAPPI